MFGLHETDVDMIINALRENAEIERAFIFGSRALGNYKKGSDVDLVITGQDVTNKTISDLNELLNEVYPLPYFFDILHYENIVNEKLKEHIDEYGVEVEFCERDSRVK